MSYDKVAKELARKIEWRVVAYDNLPQHGGCILYLEAPIKRINIEISALDRGADELAAFIRETIRKEKGAVRAIAVGVRDGELGVL